MKKEIEKIESNSYYTLPSFIENLRKQRGENEDSNINFTVILLSTTIIESVIHDLLNQTIGDSFNLETINGRMYEELSIKVNKAPWTELNSFSKLILGKRLNDCVDSELWKSIQLLYDYRNHIMHGNSIAIEKSIINEQVHYTYTGKLKKVFDFLAEKKVLDNEKPGILTSRIADYFWNETKEFVIKISKELSNVNNEIVFLMLNDAIKSNSEKE